MKKVTRRSFVAGLSAAAMTRPSALLGNAVPRPAPGYGFFDATEAGFIEPACARLIAPDSGAPGLLGAEVARYVDRQLTSPWGTGQRLYRQGPWQPGTLTVGMFSPSPATLFRNALQAINRGFEQRGTPFHALGIAAQLSFLRGLASGAAVLDGERSTVFFHLLLGMSVEGFFTGSPLARQCAVIAWPLTAFPGAYFREAGRL